MSRSTYSQKRRRLCIELQAFKERCFREGLYLTGHAMDVATKQVGYEVAALEQGKKPEQVPHE